jgi:predicted MFS family arabinose efflux permease
MISLGIGESVGVVANGWIQDTYGIKIAIYANMAEMILGFVIILLYTWNNSFNMWTASILNFVWGV